MDKALKVLDPGNSWVHICTTAVIRAPNWNLCHTDGRYGESCTLTKRVIDSTHFRVDNLTMARRDYVITQVDFCVYMDASLQGWGYYE